MDLMDLLSEQYLCLDLSDVKISVPYEDENKVAVFPAHSLILKLHSVVFRAMLESSDYSEGRTGEITVEGFLPETVEHFLRTIYTGKLPDNLSWFQYLELIKISHMYEVSSIINKCIGEIMSVNPMPLAEVCILHDVAKLRNLEVLEFMCRDKIKTSFESCLLNDLHFHLDVDSFGYFLDVFAKTIRENDGWKRAVIRWCIWRCCLSGSEITEFNIRSFLPSSSEDLQAVLKIDGSQFESTVVPDWVAKLYLNQESADLEILIQGENAIFPVHSWVRTIFKNIETSGTNTVPQISLCCISVRVLEIVLRYLYTNFFPSIISENDLLGTLKASHVYGIGELKKICIKQLISTISVSNSCEFFVLANRINSEGLQTLCMKQIEMTSGFFSNLDEACMMELINAGKMEGVKDRSRILKQWSVLMCCLNGKEPNSHNVEKYMQQPRQRNQSLPIA